MLPDIEVLVLHRGVSGLGSREFCGLSEFRVQGFGFRSVEFSVKDVKSKAFGDFFCDCGF